MMKDLNIIESIQNSAIEANNALSTIQSSVRQNAHMVMSIHYMVESQLKTMLMDIAFLEKENSERDKYVRNKIKNLMSQQQL